MPSITKAFTAVYILFTTIYTAPAGTLYSFAPFPTFSPFPTFY